MATYEVFLLGFLGALAPEVIRLYDLRTTPSKVRFSAFYFLISLLFALLGGVVAIALPATTYWGALYAGVAAPYLVTAGLKKLGSPEHLKLKALASPTDVGGAWARFLEAL